MGVYAVTGGCGCIGACALRLLKSQGHETVCIDIAKADICADLSTLDGRQKAIDELTAMHPEGIDGLIAGAGVSGACGEPGRIISVNFFGTIAIVKGCYPLLKKKRGSCVVVSSNIISRNIARMDIADLLNNNSDSEHKIVSLVSRINGNDLDACNSIYAATKYALVRWVRRHSASYAANGVRINTVAPGNVGTPMTGTEARDCKSALSVLPIPTKFGRETLMTPEEIAPAIVFLASQAACGINGIVLFVDGGTDALLNTEKVY